MNKGLKPMIFMLIIMIILIIVLLVGFYTGFLDLIKEYFEKRTTLNAG